MGRNLGFSKFAISANVWVFTSRSPYRESLLSVWKTLDLLLVRLNNFAITRETIFAMISSVIEKKILSKHKNLPCCLFCYITIFVCILSKLTIKHILSSSLRPRSTAHNNNNLLFSQASERSGILNPWLWLYNCAGFSCPDFPTRTSRMDRF